MPNCLWGCKIVVVSNLVDTCVWVWVYVMGWPICKGHGNSSYPNCFFPFISEMKLPLFQGRSSFMLPSQPRLSQAVSSNSSQLCMACVGGDTLSSLHSWHPSLAWEVRTRFEPENIWAMLHTDALDKSTFPHPTTAKSSKKSCSYLTAAKPFSGFASKSVI